MSVVVDKFAGPGGWDVAARELGLEPLGLEVDSQACAIRDAAGLATVQADVMLLDPKAFAPVVGQIGSPPCPTWSNGSGAPAVKRAQLDVLRIIRELGDGRDTRAESGLSDGDLLVVEPLRWALELEPSWVALEQVPAVLPVWEATAQALERRGYHVWTGILDAADYGVPQERRRAVLAARRSAPFLFPFAPRPRAAPVDVLDWAPDDVVGFPRRADSRASLELNGTAYRARDLRVAARPTFTLTSKSRSWVRITADGTRHPLELDEAIALQGFPAGYPFGAAGSRSAAFEHLANTVPPPLARAILEEAIA